MRKFEEKRMKIQEDTQKQAEQKQQKMQEVAKLNERLENERKEQI